MSRLSFLSRLLTIVCVACFLMAQNACKCPCDEVSCTDPVVVSPSYYNSQYELLLKWTEEPKTAYTLNAYLPALQQVIAYEVKGGSTTLQLADMHPLSLSAENECCETETPIELAAECDYPESLSVSLSPTVPFLATFEWSPVSGAVGYLITVFDSLGNNIQAVELPATPTTAEFPVNENANYVAIQTLCAIGVVSLIGPSTPILDVFPLTSTRDVEKINETDEVWTGRVTIDPFDRVRFIELTVNNLPNDGVWRTYKISAFNSSNNYKPPIVAGPLLFNTSTGSIVIIPHFSVPASPNHSIIIEIVITP